MIATERPSPDWRTVTSALLALLVTSTLLTYPAAADVRGRPNIEVYLPDNRLTPGDETTLAITLLNNPSVLEVSERNPGLTDVVTTARGVRVSIESGDAPIELKTASRALGNVPEGASPPANFRVVVDEDADPGRYKIDVNVKYTYTRFLGEADDSGREGVRYDEGVFEEFTATVVVEPRATFALSGVESNVSIGTTGTLTVALHNDGAAMAENANVRIQSENPAVTVGAADAPASSFVGDWEAGATERITVRTTVAPDAVVRSYALTASVEYDDPDGLRRGADPVPFGLVPDVEGAFTIDRSASDLRVGEKGRLNGTVRNVGGTLARNAVLVVESTGQTISPTEREVALGSLSPGAEAEFGFEFDVSDQADAGPRQFSFVVQYRDADGSTINSDPLDVRAPIEPERDVFEITDVNGTLGTGESGPFTLRIRNDGPEPVTDVSAKLFADDPLSATDDEAFIDRLAPGENTTVTFGLAVGSSALVKSYPVSIDFQYDDADGDTLLSDTYRVPVRVSESTGTGVLPGLGGNSALLLVVGLAALLVGATVIVLRRRGDE